MDSYYESESKLLGDMNIRCARQAGLIALLDKVFFKKGLEWWAEDSPMPSADVVQLYNCTRLCYLTSGVFFCEGLSKWRNSLSEDSVIELIRRRRAKALTLSISLLYQAYDTPCDELRAVVRRNVVQDSEHLINLYIECSEVCQYIFFVSIEQKRDCQQKKKPTNTNRESAWRWRSYPWSNTCCRFRSATSMK